MPLNMMGDGILISLEIAAYGAFRHRAFAKLCWIDLLALIDPQTLHAVSQTLVCTARSRSRITRTLRRMTTIEPFVGVRDGVVAAADAFALCVRIRSLRGQFVAGVAC
jgi:hypothetical protein